jgi:hypothetical protein
MLGVADGVRVAVGLGVLDGVRVALGLGVLVEEGLGRRVGVWLAVALGVGLEVGRGVATNVGVVALGVVVGLGDGLADASLAALVSRKAEVRLAAETGRGGGLLVVRLSSTAASNAPMLATRATMAHRGRRPRRAALGGERVRAFCGSPSPMATR